MAAYLVRRAVHALVVLVLISVATFVIVHLSPGGPEILFTGNLPPSDRQYIIHNLGLDQPLHVQFVRWFGAVLRGDFGRSFNQQRPVLDLILERLPATLILASAALGLSILIGVPLGVAAARRPNSWIDYSATGMSVFGVSIPSFWLGIILILLFSVRWRLLPSSGMATVGAAFSLGDLLRHLAMPAGVLALVYLAQVASYTRTSMLDVMRRDFVRTARAKGLRESVVLARHALRNGLDPGHYGHRAAHPPPGRWGRHYRNHLFVAGDGAVGRGGRVQTRLPAGHGDHRGLCARRDRQQPARRCRLRAGRSPRQGRR